MALRYHIDVSLNRLPDHSWRRRLGRPRITWSNQLRDIHYNTLEDLWRSAIHRGGVTRRPSPATWLMMNNTGMQRCASSRRDYRNILWCKGCYFWHIATSGEKLGQSRLSIRTRRQRQTTSESHHRLPAEQRVTCKITTLTFKVLSSSTPMLYLSKLIQAAIPVQPPQLSDAPLLSSREHKLNLLGGHWLQFRIRSDIRFCRTAHTCERNLISDVLTWIHTCFLILGLQGAIEKLTLYFTFILLVLLLLQQKNCKTLHGARIQITWTATAA